MPSGIVHQFNDPSYKYLVYRLQECPAYADLVKYASLDAEAVTKLSSYAFAWPDRRLFPIDNEDNATLSWLYVEKNASIPDEVKSEILKALDIYGIEVPKTAEKVAASPAQEQDTNLYLLPHVKRWEIHNEETVKLAQEALRENRNSLSVEDRTTAAVRLQKIASTVSEDIATDLLNDTEMCKLAGMTASDLNTVQDWIGARIVAAPDEYKPHYTKLASSLHGLEPISYDRESLVKLATMIYDLDKEAGLDMYYNKTLLDPIYTVFNTEKRAENTIDLAGKSVPVSEVMKISVEHLGDIFGDDIIPEVSEAGYIDPTKLAQILDTMPRDLKLILRKQLGY